MKYSLIIIGFFLFFTFGCADRKIVIEPLKMLNKSDTTVSNGKPVISKFDCYLIKNYKNNNSSTSYVDEFVKSNRADPSRYFEYHIFFYKESDSTNVGVIQKQIKEIGYHIDNEDDFVFDYAWTDYGKQFKRERLDSNKVSAPGKIKIRNIPVVEDSIKN